MKNNIKQATASLKTTDSVHHKTTINLTSEQHDFVEDWLSERQDADWLEHKKMKKIDKRHRFKPTPKSAVLHEIFNAGIIALSKAK